jgi:hypothetical protein
MLKKPPTPSMVLAIALSSSKSTLESTIESIISGKMDATVDGGEWGGMQTSVDVEGIDKEGSTWTCRARIGLWCNWHLQLLDVITGRVVVPNNPRDSGLGTPSLGFQGFTPPTSVKVNVPWNGGRIGSTPKEFS